MRVLSAPSFCAPALFVVLFADCAAQSPPVAAPMVGPAVVLGPPAAAPETLDLAPLPPLPGDPDFSAFVDPFIGTQGGGNVFPGPALPFGMVKLGPDTTKLGTAGYTADGDIVGFSHLHMSGVGGGPKYGVVLLVPTTGPLQVADHASPRADEIASVGRYAVRLTRYDVKVELGATRRAGFHRYTFPATRDAHILLDAGHLLTATFRPESQHLMGAAIMAVGATKIEGYGRYSGGWNLGREYKVFFCAMADMPAASWGTWHGTTTRSGARSEPDKGTPVGAYWNYETTAGQVVNVKVGVSFLGTAAACQSVTDEIPAWDLGIVRSAAVRAWNDVLGRIVIDGAGADAQAKTIFYTALYHAHLMPTDRTGENPRWKSAEPSYDDHAAVWDTFRTLHPLLTLVAPDRESAIVRSMIDVYQHDGYLPDGRSGNDNGRTQGGSNGDVVVADAFVKGLSGIDYQAAYDALIKDAETPPPDARKEGRGGLADYTLLGYVSTTYERAGTRTLEYSLDDWAIAQVARGLGRDGDFRRFKKRAGNWANLWNPALAADGFTGFIGARKVDESWVADFSLTAGGGWGDFFYQGDSWLYSLDVPHDVRALIARCGGPEAFVRRLDVLFDRGHWRIDSAPASFIPMLYLWAGRPDRAADRVRAALAIFKVTPDGLPGSDRAGALSAWYVFAAMGIVPNAGTDQYLIVPPRFGRTVVRLGNGKELVIVARGLGGQNRYIRAANLGGKPLTQAWFRHGDLKQGNTLTLGMGPSPSDWGTTTPPPSMSDP